MELTQNHFELFGLPVAFDVDAQQLAERYRELQRILHPDRYANASDRERRLSIQHAAQVNEAFQTLKSSLRRARYLLQLKGVEFDDEKETHLDPAFLMEQMELREALADQGRSRSSWWSKQHHGGYQNQTKGDGRPIAEVVCR